MDFEEKTLKRESKFKGHIFEVAVDEVLLILLFIAVFYF